MRLLIVHLSDIHFHASRNDVADRLPALAAAILSADASAKHFFIVVSGDIAATGSPTEYDVAEEFFASLRTALISERSSLEIHTVFVPGNHDVDGAQITAARPILVSSILADEARVSDDSILTPVLVPQTAFFEFAGRMAHRAYPSEARLFFRDAYVIGERTIAFNCYNTAWASTIPEQPNKIFPLSTFADDGIAYDLVVSVLHHPPAWFSPDVARTLRAHLERTSDIILTGHEHEPSFFSKDLLSGPKPQYAEGGVLQGGTQDGSSFNVIVLDLQETARRLYKFSWDEHLYRPREASNWVRFERGRTLRRSQFVQTPAFFDLLTDVGTPFTHPAKSILVLDDLYVDPELIPLPTFNPADDASINASDTDRLIGGGRVLLTGPEQCGKTTLAKMMVRRLHHLGYIPLLLNGQHLNKVSDHAIEAEIRKALGEQYEGDRTHEFDQLPKSKRALFIDDLDDSQLNARGRSTLLSFLCDRFGVVVAFVSDLYWLEQLAGEPAHDLELLRFTSWQISEFGNYLRGRLIEKWYSVDREAVVDEAHLSRQVAYSQKLFKTLRGTNLFPSNPLNILIVLQAEQTQKELNVLGHGYIYEALITARLAVWPSEMPRDAIATLLARIAYDRFKLATLEFGEDELAGYVEAYYQEFKLRLPLEQVRRECVRCSLLEHAGRIYRFKHPFVYYYFVAKYIQRYLHDSERSADLRRSIKEMARTVFVAEHAYVLIFLVYLTQEREVIGELLSQAKTYYADQKPCDLDEDVAFLNVVGGTTPPYELTVSGARDDWHAEQQRLDAEGDDEDETLHVAGELATLNAAMKTLQILGQVLRSFAGSLEASLKVEVARECYLLTLRTMAVFINELRANWPSALEGYVEAQREVRRDISEAELRVECEQFICGITQIIVQALLKRLAYAVGYEHLTEIYGDVLRSFDIPIVAIEVIDQTIHLENFLAVDAQTLMRVYERVKKNILPTRVLRNIVYDYLRLFKVDHRTRQVLAEKFEFRVNDPRFLQEYKVH